MRLLQRMADQALLLGGMLWRQRPGCSAVAVHAPLLHRFPLLPAGQGLAERAVPIVVRGAFGFVPEGVQDKNQQQHPRNGNKTQVTLTQQHGKRSLRCRKLLRSTKSRILHFGNTEPFSAPSRTTCQHLSSAPSACNCKNQKAAPPVYCRYGGLQSSVQYPHHHQLHNIKDCPQYTGNLRLSTGHIINSSGLYQGLVSF